MTNKYMYFIANWKMFGGLKTLNTLNKVVKFLMQMYPNKKQDEVELLAQISTKKEIKEWAKEHGIEDLKL